MTRIYRTTDRIPVKVDGIKIYLSPLSHEQKAEVQSHMIGFAKGDVKAASRGVVLSLKYSIKGIEGLKTADGEAYSLEFENGVLTDDCVSDLLNADFNEKLAVMCSSLLHGVPREFTGNDGHPLPGVELIKEKSKPKKS